MNTRLVLFCVLLGSLAACKGEAGDAEKKKGAPVQRQLSTADVIQAKPGRVADSVAFTGTLNALTSSSVSAEVEARVKEVRVREGEPVKAGQVLAVLDAEALGQSVAEQEAQMSNTESRLRLAKVKLDKQKELLQKGFISQVAFDEFASDYKVKEGEAKAQAAQLARARRQLADAEVKAPISGIIYERKINPGEVAGRYVKLFSIADLSVLEIAATVPARQVSRVQTGMKAQFSVDGQNQPFAGEVVRINPVAQAGTRSFTLFVRVANKDGRLKVGQFAKGGVVLSETSKLVALPVTAVHDMKTQPWVMVVQKGRLVKRPVRVALNAEQERSVAVEGVQPGEAVIAVDLLGVKTGDAVTLPAKLA